VTIYKNIDKTIVVLCEEYKLGTVSVGELKDGLLKAAQEIISLEDREERYFLQNAEAEIDGNIALYYGAEGVDHLYDMYTIDDKMLSELTRDIIDKIIKKFLCKNQGI
jgi:hypothetical protein